MRRAPLGGAGVRPRGLPDLGARPAGRSTGWPVNRLAGFGILATSCAICYQNYQNGSFLDIYRGDFPSRKHFFRVGGTLVYSIYTPPAETLATMGGGAQELQ